MFSSSIRWGYRSTSVNRLVESVVHNEFSESLSKVELFGKCALWEIQVNLIQMLIAKVLYFFFSLRSRKSP